MKYQYVVTIEAPDEISQRDIGNGMLHCLRAFFGLLPVWNRSNGISVTAILPEDYEKISNILFPPEKKL